MIEPGEKWRRFVAVDAVAATLAAALVWGIYLYWLAELHDFFLLGAMIGFLIDICGLIGLTAAAAALLFGWRKRKPAAALAGLVLQIIYGLPYSWLCLVISEGEFVTPGMLPGVPMLAMGLAGLFFYVITPKEDRK